MQNSSNAKKVQSLKDVIMVHGKPEGVQKEGGVLKGILRWFEKTRPEKTARDFLAQVACHYEEVAECTEALGHPAETIRKLSENFRIADAAYADTDYHCKPLPEGWRKDLLDSLCDQIVTAIGVAHCANLDIVGALSEVNYSNWSKFENCEPIRDEHGKIIKGRNYKTPVLDQYVLPAPKWVIPEPKAGMVFRLRDDTELVAIVCVSAMHDNDSRRMITYRVEDSDEYYTAPENVFRRRFEPVE